MGKGKPHKSQAWIPAPAHYVVRTVGAGIVDNDDPVDPGGDTRDYLADKGSLVSSGDDNTDFQAIITHSSSWNVALSIVTSPFPSAISQTDAV